jgi:branched-chain amino acid transport system ATP-binding protein
MLKVEQIETFYGSSQALFGVSLEVRDGEVVTLLGRNGMGKSTTVKSVIGLTPVTNGQIFFTKRKSSIYPAIKLPSRVLAWFRKGDKFSPT